MGRARHGRSQSGCGQAGIGDRVRFEVVDVTRELPANVQTGAYDVVLAFEMIHDLARPQAALATMRRLGKPDAIHLVVDENVAESFEAPTGNPIERLFYAASVLHCLPVGLSESPSAGTGTVMRPTSSAGTRRRPGSGPSRRCRSSTTCSASTSSPGKGRRRGGTGESGGLAPSYPHG
jgi:hypothetical protein